MIHTSELLVFACAMICWHNNFMILPNGVIYYTVKLDIIFTVILICVINYFQMVCYHAVC